MAITVKIMKRTPDGRPALYATRDFEVLPVSIGRDAACSICLEDPHKHMSRFHAEIQEEDGTYWMAWLGMRTPTFDLALRRPAMRKRMTRRLPQDEWLFPNINTGGVVKFDEAGRIVEALGDLGGQSHPMVTSMRTAGSRRYRLGPSSRRTSTRRKVAGV